MRPRATYAALGGVIFPPTTGINEHRGAANAARRIAAGRRAAGYRARPRIAAGWPGRAMRLPVSTSLSPSTLRIDTSPSRKLPT